MEAKVISQVISYGPQHWRLNADGSWSALAFGYFDPEQNDPRFDWISIPTDKVPIEVIKSVK